MKEKYDVIVIGSGIAGLSSAIEARLAGADVLVLEKMKKAGGNSLISDGGIAAAGTDEQKKAGISDSPALMYYDMMKAGERINSPELVKILTENSAEAFRWTKDFLHVPYLDRIDIFGGHKVPRCYTAQSVSGRDFIRALLKKAEELSIEIRFGHIVQKIFEPEEGGVCIQVSGNYQFRTDSAGSHFRIKALRGLVLATGGFASDLDFRAAQDPRLDKTIKSTGQPFVDASVLKMALGLGAAPIHLSRIQLGPWASPEEEGYGEGPSFSEYILFQYGILVDPEKGGRFVNELSDRKTLSDKMMFMGRHCVGICDNRAVEGSGWNIDKALKKGVVKIFQSLESLCAFYQMDYAPVKRTVLRFNMAVKSGRDSEFGKPVLEDAATISTPPFYGMKLYPKVHYTMGGIQIDEEARVLDLHGNAIPHLFAAGEITGGIHGASRLGSCSITDCIVFGRIAGRTSGKIRS